jgi:mannosyltransferase OCH1-like enzyme
MIPKVIYMCHKSLDKIKIYSQNWKVLNPEYDIKLYDDEMCKLFLLEEYGQLYIDIFNFIPDGPIKCDFWRVCIINKYGGLYVDADIQPLIPLNEYIEDDDNFVTCISNNFKPMYLAWQFNPHFILSNKNNIVLEKCIDRYIEYYTNKIPYKYWDWSICKFMVIPGISEKKSQVIYLNNEKYKFLLELKSMNDCEYNGKIVLKNRYDEYRTHQFL